MHSRKNSSKGIWPFQTFLHVQTLKISMNTPSKKKFFEADQLVLKIFLGADFENNHENIFEKNLMKLCDLF